MPIVTVELVGGRPHARDGLLARTIADAVADVIGCSPGQTWVRLHWLERENYAENATRLNDGELPVFVSVLHRSPPTGPELEAEIAALTRAIARVVSRPANLVHIEYAPAAAGRMSFGGNLVQ